MAAPRLIGIVRAELGALADPERAKAQQAYMKSAMPYYGVGVPGVRAIARSLEIPSVREDWEKAILALYRGAKKREERYVAIMLANRSKAFLDARALPILEEIIVTGAWWDLVDSASDVLAKVLVNDEKKVRAAMMQWRKSDDIWKRRASIICQLPRKQDTDLALLEACIAPSLGRKEFWLRKAIGWALRQYARTDPAWVSRYVEAHRDRLSGLSIREALKHVTSSPAPAKPQKKL